MKIYLGYYNLEPIAFDTLEEALNEDSKYYDSIACVDTETRTVKTIYDQCELSDYWDERLKKEGRELCDKLVGKTVQEILDIFYEDDYLFDNYDTYIVDEGDFRGLKIYAYDIDTTYFHFILECEYSKGEILTKEDIKNRKIVKYQIIH